MATLVVVLATVELTDAHAQAGPPPISISTVHGAFYLNPANSGSLDVNFLPPIATSPVFTQDFPTIDFNPPASAQVSCSNSTGVNENTRPFTDVIPNPDGTCTSLVAQGNGQQAGLGALPAGLFTFQAIFTANLSVAAAGQVTFNFYSDDGWMLGAGPRLGGTEQPTRVCCSGSFVNPLPSTPLKGLSVVGSFNVPSAPAQNTATVAFPVAGTYPIELDYTECCGGQLALVLGSSFGNPIPPAPSDVDVSNAIGIKGEPSIAASGSNSLVIGATTRFYTPRNGGVYTGTVLAIRSTDGGQSWTPVELPAAQSALQCAGSTATVFNGDPVVTAGVDPGTYYYAYLSGCIKPGNETSELDVARSTDGGQTWTVVTAAAGIGKTLQDRPTIAVDRSPTSPTFRRIYIAWTANDVAGQDPHIALSFSDDQGVTWSKEDKHVDGSGSVYVWASSIAISNNGTLGLSWYDYGADQVRFAASTKLTGKHEKPHFSGSPVIVGSPGMSSIHYVVAPQPDNGINPDPTLLVDNDASSAYAGRMYLIWTAVASGIGGESVTNVVASYSMDGGSTWSTPLMVNDDNRDPSKWGSTNFFGQAALDPNTGTLHLSFYSTRTDALCKSGSFCLGVGCLPTAVTCPGPQPPPPGCLMNCKTDVFYARSINGGLAFSANVRLTSQSSDESQNNPARCQGCFQYGDYEGIVVAGGIAHPVWTDARFAGPGSSLGEQVFTISKG